MCCFILACAGLTFSGYLADFFAVRSNCPLESWTWCCRYWGRWSGEKKYTAFWLANIWFKICNSLARVTRAFEIPGFEFAKQAGTGRRTNRRVQREGTARAFGLTAAAFLTLFRGFFLFCFVLWCCFLRKWIGGSCHITGGKRKVERKHKKCQAVCAAPAGWRVSAPAAGGPGSSSVSLTSGRIRFVRWNSK